MQDNLFEQWLKCNNEEEGKKVINAMTLKLQKDPEYVRRYNDYYKCFIDEGKMEKLEDPKYEIINDKIYKIGLLKYKIKKNHIKILKNKNHTIIL